MTKPKKRSDEFKITVCKLVKILPFLAMTKPPIVTIAEKKKLKTRSARCIFLTIVNPKRKTLSAIHDVPTHQFTDWPKNTQQITAAIATGLKICFLLIA